MSAYLSYDEFLSTPRPQIKVIGSRSGREYTVRKTGVEGVYHFCIRPTPGYRPPEYRIYVKMISIALLIETDEGEFLRVNGHEGYRTLAKHERYRTLAKHERR